MTAKGSTLFGRQEKGRGRAEAHASLADLLFHLVIRAVKKIMFLNSSLTPLSIAPPSGFVAFDGGGVVDIETHRVAAKAITTARQPAVSVVSRLLPSDAPATGDLLQSATWQPTAGRFARRVEGVSIIAICGYFIFGFASLAGWI